MQNDMINSPIRNLDILEVAPGQPINEVVVDIKQGQYTDRLTVPPDRIGEFIVTVQMDECGDDGCNACDSVRCTTPGLTANSRAECSIDDNRQAQCTCPDGFTQSEALIPLASCAQSVEQHRLWWPGTCVPTYTGPLCLCDQGYVLDPSNREVCPLGNVILFGVFYHGLYDAKQQPGGTMWTLLRHPNRAGRQDLTAFRQCVIDNRCPTQSGQPRNQCINAHCVDQAAGVSTSGPTRCAHDMSGRDGGGNPNDDLCQFGEVLISLQEPFHDSGYLVQLNGCADAPC